MLYISKDGVIELTRGDTARLSVDTTYIDSDEKEYPYLMAEGDTLVFSIKKNVKDFKSCVEKKAINGNEFHLKPEDTAKLAFGKYVYDVELQTADGERYTIIEKTTFKICEEVSAS